MAKSHGSVRMGPMSILVLLIVLSLAVMAVLNAATAKATYASAARQAAFTSDTYLNESAAQRFVASLDETLLEARAGLPADDEDAKASLSAEAAAADVEEALPGMLRACADEYPECTMDATVQGTVITVSATSPNGRVLNVVIVVQDGGTYEIEQWKTSAEWSNETNDTLWTGNVGESNTQGDVR